MGEIGKQKLAKLTSIGEDELFGRITSGTSVSDLLAEVEVGWKLWAKWLDAEKGRRERYEQTKKAAAHFYASRAVNTAQSATTADVAVSRLQVDTDKWIAAKLNEQYDTRQRDVAVNISVSDLHAQAAELLRSVGDTIDLDDDDYDVMEGEISSDDVELERIANDDHAWGEHDV